METEVQINETISKVSDALFDKCEGYSIGQLVADLEGDGTTSESDPYHVLDRHFLQDMERIDKRPDGFPDEHRDSTEVTELLDLFTVYWKENPDLQFCQIVCNAHVVQNGLDDFSIGETGYAEPVSELTDEQLREYLESKVEVDDE